MSVKTLNAALSLN